MFKDWLNSTFTVTRTTTTKDATTHIASTATQNLGPFPCRVSMTSKSNGNYAQAQPQAVSIQSLRLYALIDADVKTGDIVTIDTTKYTVSNVYHCNNHHIEADISYKSEV